jgi:1,4-dihydroxy-6-naphthoate synthase
MDITLGHTPDADDAFMFYALASGKIQSTFVIKHIIQDIETLNRQMPLQEEMQMRDSSYTKRRYHMTGQNLLALSTLAGGGPIIPATCLCHLASMLQAPGL